jgi:hypothetical protein
VRAQIPQASFHHLYVSSSEHRLTTYRTAEATDTTLLLNDIARYILRLDPPTLATAHKRSREPDNAASASKKVKVENGDGARTTSDASIAWRADGSTSFTASDVSFVVPVRKKLRFELIGTAEDGADGGVRGINSATGQCEVGISWNDIGAKLPFLPTTT